MIFEWHESKERSNIAKHGISFADARQVFFDPNVIFEKDQIIDDEVRTWAIGRLLNQTLLVVVHVTRDENGEEIIRIVSARKANPHERGRYFSQVFGGGTPESR
jgi:uncharacterized protein